MPLTPLLGRERELRHVLALLRQSGVRLVTLTGPGGVGKTRLALAVAAEVGETFPGGVCFIPLAALRNPELLVSTIAQALGVRASSGQPVATQIAATLGTEPSLLVLDNLEQLLAAAPEIAALLSACAGLHILVTSREALRLRGDHEVPLPPLSLPEGSRPVAAEAARAPSVALYVARAQEARAGFALTDENAPVVAEICRRLDGLPLAIELAAARSKVLTPKALLARLTHRLQLLTGGLSDLPDRQQTMRATVAWSYDLLTSDEQRLFRRLSVFSGSFSLDAAEAVASREPVPIAEREVEESRSRVGVDQSLDFSTSRLLDFVLEGLESLIDKSLLVRREEEGESGEDGPRLAMLETVREFVWEELVASGEAEAMRRRHADWFLALAEQSIPELIGPNRNAWLVRLDADYPNLRGALAWAVESGEAETALRLIEGLWRYWESRGHLAEGRTWSDRALSVDGEVDSRLRATMLYGAAVMPYRQGDYDRATELCDECLALWRAIGDPSGIAYALNGLGIITFDQGDYDRARTFLDEALALRRVEGGDRLTATLNNFGLLLYELGEYDRAHALYTESLVLSQQVQNPWGIGFALNGLGLVAHRQGDLARAVAWHEEAIALRRNGDTGNLAASLTNLAAVVRDQGDSFRAADHYQEALALRWERGEKRGTAEALAGLAELAIAGGQADLGVRLLGAVDSVREATRMNLSPPEMARQERARDAARSALGDEGFAVAMAAGRAMPLAQAVAGVEQIAIQPTPADMPMPAAANLAGLTPREMDVLRLVADGLSDRDVAVALSISPATAARHVANIFLKLDVKTRTAAATHAIRQGLV